MSDQDLSYLISLHSVNGLGSVRIKKLVDYFKNPKDAWISKKEQLRDLNIPNPVIDALIEKRKTLDPEKYYLDLKNQGIKFLTVFDSSYPALLSKIYDPPIILYFKGQIRDHHKKAIGIVGTRKVTGYGRIVTEQFTRELINYNFTIVSGLARGVDTIAHKTTVEQKGQTIAVLGGGLSQIFPPENTELAKQIVNGFGAVISEFPPSYPHLAGNFPSRNRIIAGLSLGVLVTEAAEDSGSLITARLALDEGREVFAVPGPITSSLSSGPSKLIKEGAKLVTSAAEILEELGINQTNQKNQNLDISDLTELEKNILKILENEQKHIDEICRELNKPSYIISAEMIKMEIKGFVKNLGSGVYINLLST